MSGYIGLDPRFLTNARDYFAGTGSQTVFTLSSNPGGANGILVVVSGLIQKAGTAYNLVGKTLTFTEAPPLPEIGDSTNIEIIYLQRMGTVQGANWNIPIANGTGTDTITATYSPAVTSYTTPANLMLYVVLTGSNATATPTFNANGLGAKSIRNYDGTALQAGALKGTALLRYDSGSDQFWLAGSVGSGGVSARGSLSGASVTPDLTSYAGFDWTLTANATLNFPASVPATGAWYIDLTINSTGGYTLTFASGYTKVLGYYFDCTPNARYRLWMVAKSTSAIDVNIERIL